MRWREGNAMEREVVGMNEFPSRVTLYEDGVYRWSYDLDMWRNRYILNLVIKVLLLVLGIPTLFVPCPSPATTC